MTSDLVLVTGGSGFIGAHCVVALLDAGYRVRTTVRSLTREAEVRAMVKAGGAEAGDRLSLVAADLSADAGWAEAVAGCTFVLHVASPFPATAPKHEDELIVPAREGALRVLRASKAAGVRRVVLTSSFAAIGYGQPTDQVFTEKNWTDVTAPLVAYTKSKTVAERAAWDFIAKEGGALELSVVNPVAVLGPVLGPDSSTSIQLVQRLLDGGIPAMPRISFGLVDVRDVADLHLRAMTAPEAAGERFLAVAGEPMSVAEVASVLRARLGAKASRVPTVVLPDWVVRVAALFNGTLRQLVSELGKTKRMSNEKARRVLGWAPRSNDEAIVATAQSLEAYGLLRR
jgi:nucleoside-diphosphate-sugar epimerase